MDRDIVHLRITIDANTSSQLRLDIPRSALHTPLFQCFVNYRQGLREKTPWDSSGGDSPVLSSVEIGIPKVAYDVSLEMVDYAGGECRQTLVVRKDMYSANDARRLARSLQLLIEAFAADPTLCLNQPELFDSSEILEVMKLCRGKHTVMTQVQFIVLTQGILGPSWKSQWPETIVHRIDELSRKHPHNIALWHDNKTSTYEEVLTKANSIANALKAAKVNPESPVAVLQEPSPDWISSMLGIMRVGAAYLPLDLGHPWARLAAIVQDCEPHVVLVDKNRQDISRLRRPDMQIIDVSSLERYNDPIPISATKDSLATILYTSGSSGTPKGIMLHHGALRNWAEPLSQLYGVSVETVLQQTSWTFDISLAQVLTALCFGGRLVLAPRQSRGDAQAISELIASQDITLVYSTPSEYSSWFNYDGGALNRAVTWKTAFSGGEAMPVSIVEHFRSLGRASIKLYSLYGPGECATNATSIQVLLDTDRSPISAGRPVPNYSVYVVDSKLRPVAIGVQGEICIGGPGIGRGYIGNPELTAERFVQNAIASTEDIKNGWDSLHRTGDLGRWRQDGTLLIEGRISGDTQVKLRGYRIDMCEVEHAIIEAADGALLEAVVSKRDSTTLRPEFLVAHIVCNKEDGAVEDCISRMRARLGSSLPAYMYPAVIIPLERIPMTSSGKRDRRAVAALPIPGSECKWNEIKNDLDLTETESQLKSIWQQVLADQLVRWHGSITPDQDFFHVGGSSLHLLELQAKIKEAFEGLEVPLVEMFDSSTLSAMARRIERENVTTKGQPTETMDWDRETEVPPSLLSLPSPRTQKPAGSKNQVVVLTGATGQLGGALLKAIVEDANVTRVHCIGVRDAVNRKEDIGFELNGKVILHAGDLYQARLGLSDDDANRIFAEATIIVHSAADKSYQKSFSSLRAPNLQTTKDLAIMAAAARGSRPPPDFHYISTAAMGMLVAGSKGERGAEGFIFGPVSAAACPPPAVSSSHIRRTAHGYMASKWASEVFLENLHAHHPYWRIVIHRPSLIARKPVPKQWEKEDDSTNGPVNDMLENLQYFAPRLRAVPALNTPKVGISGVLDVVTLNQVVDGLVDSMLVKNRLLESDKGSAVEYIHHVSDVELPLDNLGSWLGEAADIADGRDGWREFSAAKWARLAGEIGMRPAVVALFEDVSAKEGRVRFHKASRQ